MLQTLNNEKERKIERKKSKSLLIKRLRGFLVTQLGFGPRTPSLKGMCSTS